MSGAEAEAPPAAPYLRLAVRSGDLVAPLLARAVGILGARVGMELMRLDNAHALATTLAQQLPGALAPGAERVECSLIARGSTLDIRIGPLRDGGADALIPRGASHRDVARLGGRVRSAHSDAGEETLVIEVDGPAPVDHFLEDR